MKLYVRESAAGKRELRIDESKPLGGGGEGKIYVDLDDAQVAVKLFTTADNSRKAKIEAMIAHPPISARTGSNTNGKTRFAWPQALVVDNIGVLRGFTMLRVDTSRFFPLETLLIPNARARGSFPGDSAKDYRFRVKVARNLAAAVEQIHRAGHALVDIKPMNMFVERTSAEVIIVDCDGCLIKGQSTLFPATVATEEYLAPEFHGKVQYADMRQDLFALGMVIFRLLNNDLYPMNGIPISPDAPTSHVERIRANLLTVNPAAQIKQHAKSIQDMLPEETLKMFRSAFSHAQPLRPSAEKWIAHLEELGTKLSTCTRVPHHIALPAGCPWCELDAKALAQKSKSSAGTKAGGSASTTPPPISAGSTAYRIPRSLLAVRILSFLFIAPGFLLTGLVLFAAFRDAMTLQDYSVVKVSHLIIQTAVTGAVPVLSAAPFYYAYLNSFELEALTVPQRCWPAFFLGFPICAIVVALYFALGIDLQGGIFGGMGPISNAFDSWTGAAKILAWILTVWGGFMLLAAVIVVGKAFRGVWSKEGRDELRLEML